MISFDKMIEDGYIEEQEYYFDRIGLSDSFEMKHPRLFDVFNPISDNTLDNDYSPYIS